MLLAGGEGEDIAALSLRIHGLAAEPAGHLPDEFLGRREQAHIGTAKVQGIADGLTLAHGDVGPHFPGRGHEAEADRFGEDRHKERFL